MKQVDRDHAPAIMPAKLCFLSCHNFHREVAAGIAAEAWPDVSVAAFPARCGRPPVSWEELRALLPAACTAIVVMGRACLAGLGMPPADLPPMKLLAQEQCFHLIAGASLVADATGAGAYLMTPAWLADWRGHLEEMGFNAETGGEFFSDFADELLLLDTGIDPGVASHLAEFAHAIRLPCRSVKVGLDHTRLLLTREVLEWRLAEERQSTKECNRSLARDLADRDLAMDRLARLAQHSREAEVIAGIEELFRELFAASTWYYLRADHGQQAADPNIPADLLTALRQLDGPYAWTPSGRGFVLRIARENELLGFVLVDQLAFPEHRERFLNLALAMTGVCGLAIKEARVKADLEQNRRKVEELYSSLQTRREEERSRFARGLHDELGHLLTALSMDMNWLERRMSRDESPVAAKLETMRVLVNEVVDSVRRIIDNLRPAMLDTLGLETTLEAYAASFTVRTNIPCDLALTRENLDLSDKLAIGIFRIVQEALNNIQQHAEATRASIQLKPIGDALMLVIEDNGMGLPDSATAQLKGFGLREMNERVSSLNGHISITGDPGQGVRIEAVIPTSVPVNPTRRRALHGAA